MKPGKPFVYATLAVSVGPLFGELERHDPALPAHHHSPHQNHTPLPHAASTYWVASGSANAAYSAQAYREPRFLVAGESIASLFDINE